MGVGGSVGRCAKWLVGSKGAPSEFCFCFVFSGCLCCFLGMLKKLLLLLLGFFFRGTLFHSIFVSWKSDAWTVLLFLIFLGLLLVEACVCRVLSLKSCVSRNYCCLKYFSFLISCFMELSLLGHLVPCDLRLGRVRRNRSPGLFVCVFFGVVGY